MIVTFILAILVGTLIGVIFIQPKANQMLWQLYDENDNK